MTTGLSGDLHGKVVVITGGTQGIGGAAALRCAEWGAAGLVLAARDTAKGEAAVAASAALGCRAVFVPVDLAGADAPGQILAACDTAFGRIDGLVNAAALTDRGGFDDATPEFFDRMMAVNARAPFLLMQGALQRMRRDSIAGSIVNVLSMNAHCGAPDLSAYSASKGALSTLTRNAANAFLKDRIRVNGINVGWADTPNERALQSRIHPDGPRWLETASAARPFGRLINTDELADLIAFLLSRHSGMMTGTLLDYEQRVLGAA